MINLRLNLDASHNYLETRPWQSNSGRRNATCYSLGDTVSWWNASWWKLLLSQICKFRRFVLNSCLDSYYDNAGRITDELAMTQYVHPCILLFKVQSDKLRNLLATI